MRRTLLHLCIMLLPITTYAANMTSHPRPIVLELFTSQGCSSCPPADRLIGEIANRSEVIALTYHVDYWDYLGWHDPFASTLNTQRQRAYAHALNLSSIFTPQLIVDGRASLVGSDRHGMNNAIHPQMTEVELALASTNDQVAVDLSDTKVTETLEIAAIAYQSYASTTVPHGENSGSTLKEYNVVRWFNSLGSWSGQAKHYHVEKKMLPREADHLVVLVQKANQGPIVGSSVIAIK